MTLAGLHIWGRDLHYVEPPIECKKRHTDNLVNKKRQTQIMDKNKHMEIKTIEVDRVKMRDRVLPKKVRKDIWPQSLTNLQKSCLFYEYN